MNRNFLICLLLSSAMLMIGSEMKEPKSQESLYDRQFRERQDLRKKQTQEFQEHLAENQRQIEKIQELKKLIHQKQVQEISDTDERTMQLTIDSIVDYMKQSNQDLLNKQKKERAELQQKHDQEKKHHQALQAREFVEGYKTLKEEAASKIQSVARVRAARKERMQPRGTMGEKEKTGGESNSELTARISIGKQDEQALQQVVSQMSSSGQVGSGTVSSALDSAQAVTPQTLQVAQDVGKKADQATKQKVAKLVQMNPDSSKIALKLGISLFALVTIVTGIIVLAIELTKKKHVVKPAKKSIKNKKKKVVKQVQQKLPVAQQSVPLSVVKKNVQVPQIIGN